MEYSKLANEIIRLVGGSGNIEQVWHCVTRLRFNLVDNAKIDSLALKQLEGVIDVQAQGNQQQIIIGTHVAKVFEAIQEGIHGQPKNKMEKEPEKKEQPSVLNIVMDTISGIFAPVMVAIIGAGLVKGVLSLLLFFQLVPAESTEYLILSMISDAPFYFLPFLIAFPAARKFKTNEYLAVTLAGILMYPSLLDLAKAGEVSSLSFFSLPVQVVNYSSSVIPIILSVWLLSYVHKLVSKIVPGVVRTIFVPLLDLLITAPIMLIVIAPLGNIVGVYIERFFAMLFSVAGPVAGLLMGGILPVIIITGMQYAFFPSTLTGLQTLGYDLILLPMSLVSNMGQAGATLGAALKTKDKEMKATAYSAFLSAVFGITEPAIYGVTLKLKRPFYAALAGGAVGGAIFGTFAVKAFSFGVPGITAIPTYIEQGTTNFIWALSGVGASFITGLVISIITFPKEPQVAGDSPSPIRAADYGKDRQQALERSVQSPVSGKICDLTEVPDKVFSQRIIGQGVAVIPNEGIVHAPVDGIISMITPTNHAIGITSAEGMELIIHIGLETVNEQGENFSLNVKEGQAVKAGDLIMKFDHGVLTGKGYNLITPIIVTNMDEGDDIALLKIGEIKAREPLFYIIKR